jgi:hypothetical protein
MDDLVRKIIMWRTELERQKAGLGIMNVFNSICVFLGEQQRELSKSLREFATLSESIGEDDAIIQQLRHEIEQYKLQESLLMDRLKKMTLDYKEMKQNSRLIKFYEMAEENLKFAQENADLRVEIEKLKSGAAV